MKKKKQGPLPDSSQAISAVITRSLVIMHSAWPGISRRRNPTGFYVHGVYAAPKRTFLAHYYGQARSNDAMALLRFNAEHRSLRLKDWFPDDCASSLRAKKHGGAIRYSKNGGEIILAVAGVAPAADEAFALLLAVLSGGISLYEARASAEASGNQAFLEAIAPSLYVANPQPA